MHHAFSKSGFESAKNVKSMSKSRDHKGEAGQKQFYNMKAQMGMHNIYKAKDLVTSERHKLKTGTASLIINQLSNRNEDDAGLGGIETTLK